jgi:murein DD-endopeptidase MepM/ murein hydrolase activator NlpD
VRLLLAFLLLLASASELRAGTLELTGQLIQGGLVFGKVDPGSRVLLGERGVRVAGDGRFVFGFGRDAPARATISVTYPDGNTRRLPLAVEQRTYRIQRIDGLPQKLVTPPPELLARIHEEHAKVEKARSGDRDEPLFESGFRWPLQGPISGVYGSQRILNGKPRQPHYGVDIAAPAGTPFVAPADGVVVLAEPDLYYSGGTLMLDHGHGLTSAFLHMSSLAVKVGDRVAQGDVLGKVGATGRVTGAHLDWRMNWFAERIDPQLLVPPMPEAEKQGTAD